jgi:hypothetical protein
LMTAVFFRATWTAYRPTSHGSHDGEIRLTQTQFLEINKEILKK